MAAKTEKEITDEAVKKLDAENQAVEDAKDRELAAMKKQLEEAKAKLEDKDKIEQAAKKALTTIAKVANTAGTPIQCLLRRKNGTHVSFGNNNATKTTYHFKPINDTDDAPHVCNVEVQEHADRFLAISEGYRLYRGDAGPVETIPVKQGDDSNSDPFKNRYDDILSIDFETADNEVVTGWAAEVLDLTIAQNAKIKIKADNLGVKVLKGDNMTELLRKIGQAMQAEEQLASDQANKG